MMDLSTLTFPKNVAWSVPGSTHSCAIGQRVEYLECVLESDCIAIT